MNYSLNEEYPNIKEKVDDIFKSSEEIYKYIFPPKDEEAKYSLGRVAQEDAPEILYNDIKELVEEAEKVDRENFQPTEEEHLAFLDEIFNRVELIKNIFTSSFDVPSYRRMGFRTQRDR